MMCLLHAGVYIAGREIDNCIHQLMEKNEPAHARDARYGIAPIGHYL